MNVMSGLCVCGVLLVFTVLWGGGEGREDLMGPETGYFMRENSLVAPYQGRYVQFSLTNSAKSSR